MSSEMGGWGRVWLDPSFFAAPHLVPSPPFKLAACLLLVEAAPLFEEEGIPRAAALVANVDHPEGGKGDATLFLTAGVGDGRIP